jgi:hypothetical protein
MDDDGLGGEGYEGIPELVWMMEKRGRCQEMKE